MPVRTFLMIALTIGSLGAWANEKQSYRTGAFDDNHMIYYTLDGDAIAQAVTENLVVDSVSGVRLSNARAFNTEQDNTYYSLMTTISLNISYAGHDIRDIPCTVTTVHAKDQSLDIHQNRSLVCNKQGWPARVNGAIVDIPELHLKDMELPLVTAEIREVGRFEIKRRR